MKIKILSLIAFFALVFVVCDSATLEARGHRHSHSRVGVGFGASVAPQTYRRPVRYVQAPRQPVVVYQQPYYYVYPEPVLVYPCEPVCQPMWFPSFGFNFSFSKHR